MTVTAYADDDRAYLADTDRYDITLTVDEAARCWLDDFFAMTPAQQERAYRIATDDERDLIDAVRAVAFAVATVAMDRLERIGKERAA